MRYLSLIAVAAALPGLSACSQTSAMIEDPVGFECRERAASLMSVDFDKTAAQPVNIDMFGTANYNVTAAGVTFRCVADKNQQITSFSRL